MNNLKVHRRQEGKDGTCQKHLTKVRSKRSVIFRRGSSRVGECKGLAGSVSCSNQNSTVL